MLRIQRILRIFPFEVIDLTKENRVSIAKHNDMNGKFCSLLLYKPKQSQLAIVFFSAVLGFRCCSRAFSSHGRQQLLQAWCVGFSLLWLLWLQSKGSRERALSSCGTWAQLPRGMLDLSRPGMEPVSPALQGGFLTTGPPGESLAFISSTSCQGDLWEKSQL